MLEMMVSLYAFVAVSSFWVAFGVGNKLPRWGAYLAFTLIAASAIIAALVAVHVWLPR